MRTVSAAVWTALGVWCVASAGTSGVLQNDSGATRCLAANSNAKIVWTAPAGSALQSARVYFRSDNAKAEHFVEMRLAGSTAYSAILPKAAAIATAIDYRIAVAGSNGEYVTRSAGRLAVTKTCAPEALSAEEQKRASSLVVGATAEGPIVPVGFRCDGIVGQVTKAGELRSYSACSEIAIASMSATLSNRRAASTANRAAATTKPETSSGTAPAHTAIDTTGGLQVGPLHHRTPRRAPQPAQPPQPRLQEPVSQSRP